MFALKIASFKGIGNTRSLLAQGQFELALR